MIVGVPREVKDNEFRVALTPEGARELSDAGHTVLLEEGAAEGSSLPRERYERAGAKFVASADEVWAESDLILKVKEPVAEEFGRMREGQILFTYLHLAASRELTEELLRRKVSAVAYETVQDRDGRLPLLAPMSEVAGRMAVQAGASCLEIVNGGRGLLLGGVPGVPPAKVVIIGGGVVGSNAAVVATGMGAHVTILDRSIERLAVLDTQFRGIITTIYSTAQAIDEEIETADLVIGAVLVPGAAAPKLITRDMVKGMKRGSVLVDVAIDQGGCSETSRPTTHAAPTYVEEGVVHYCVANMPGAVARTSTFALNNATLPFIVTLAEKGYARALKDDTNLREGLNVHRGRITYRAVAEAQKSDYPPAEQALAS